MKIRIISDLHVDVNKRYMEIEFGDYGFLKHTFETDIILVAGDTAGSSYKEHEFFSILRNEDVMTPVIAVGGNHLGYDYYKYRQTNAMLGYNNPLDQTKEDCIKQMKKDPFVTYLDNDYIEQDNYIIYGGTMYSDFLLYGKKQKDACKNNSERWLNDFRYVYTFDKKQNMVRPVTSDDYEKWFKKFIRGLNKCIKETNKDIIVLSHFAPSIKSIESKYLNKPDRFSQPGSSINAVYASNLEDYIKDNPRIKLWVHGHVHSSFDYNIGQCRVVCEPYGYFHDEGTLVPHEYMGKIIEL